MDEPVATPIQQKMFLKHWQECPHETEENPWNSLKQNDTMYLDLHRIVIVKEWEHAHTTHWSPNSDSPTGDGLTSTWVRRWGLKRTHLQDRKSGTFENARKRSNCMLRTLYYLTWLYYHLQSHENILTTEIVFYLILCKHCNTFIILWKLYQKSWDPTIVFIVPD